MTEVTTYRFVALQHDGIRTSGTVSANSRDDALNELHDRGLYALEVAPTFRPIRRTATIPLLEVALGLRILANLLESGLSVGKTLGMFEQMAPKRWRPGLEPIRTAVRDGKTLAAALAASPLDIPPVVIGMLAAGEMGSGLAPAVHHAAELMERSAATRSAIRGALAYPLVLAVAGIASVVLLVGVVLPRFAALLTDIGQTLPASTRLVLATSNSARMLSLPIAVLAGLLGLSWTFWMRTIEGRVRWHRWMLHVPFLGAIRHSAATGRVCAAMGSMLDSGVPLSLAFQHGARAAGDEAVERALRDARERIVRGERPSSALADTHAVTTTAVQLIRAGEESGRLADMFSHAAVIEQASAEQRVRSAVRLLEPALILVFGGVVAIVAAALLQAVYSVRPA
jgi:type II secretory pathway component PulF